MGIRFRCHLCRAELNVKDHLAGKRGRCPECGGSFRIPLQDSEFSLRPDDRSQLVVTHQGRREAEKEPTFAERAEEIRPASSDKSGARQSHTASDSPRSDNQSEHSIHPELPDTEPFGSPTGTPSGKLIGSQSHPIRQNVPPAIPVAPSVITEAPALNWYVRPNSGGQYGPAPGTVLWQWLTENRVGADSLVWREDWAEWQVASQVFPEHFLGGLPPSAVPPKSSPPPSNFRLAEQKVAQPVLSHESEVPLVGSRSSFAEKNREYRKQKRQRNYIILVSVLILTLLVLLGGLIIVLWL